MLVLGGARSGKSAFAERLAAESGDPVIYVATATARDAEMAERIRQHRANRPVSWRTIEEPRDVARAVAAASGESSTVLLEDLTLLLSNLMDPPQHGSEHVASDEPIAGSATPITSLDAAEVSVRSQVDQLCTRVATTILVSNEIGLGVVPAYPLGRAFRDALGRVNQHAAARADEVFLMVAGLPLRLKPNEYGS